MSTRCCSSQATAGALRRHRPPLLPFTASWMGVGVPVEPQEAAAVSRPAGSGSVHRLPMVEEKKETEPRSHQTDPTKRAGMTGHLII